MDDRYREKEMNRREFAKLIALVPFAGLGLSPSEPVGQEMKVILECSNDPSFPVPMKVNENDYFLKVNQAGGKKECVLTLRKIPDQRYLRVNMQAYVGMEGHKGGTWDGFMCVSENDIIDFSLAI